MYTLIRGLWHYLSQKDEYSILILGLDGAGKTTYLEQTKINFVDNYKSIPLNKITTTVGLNIGQITIDGVKLKFWDLGGQEELQSLWDKYYAESHGIIYIIDSADVDRFDQSKEAFDKMIKNPTLNGAPLMILANKQDIQSSTNAPGIPTNKAISSLKFSAKFSGKGLEKEFGKGSFAVSEINKIFYDSVCFVGSRECTIRGVSALNGVGITEGIKWIVDKVKQNAIRRPPVQPEIT